MFTGLIQGTGSLQLLDPYRLQVSTQSEAIGSGLEIGDSIAVDGICLTVEHILPYGFIVTVSPETLQRTTLSQKANTTALVNLEASLQVGAKLGGHFVTGHVDGVGQVEDLRQTATAWEISFIAPDEISRYIIPKGSIAVNGVSLTVASCNSAGTWFKVAVIPHSFAATNLHTLRPGDLVNLEADLLGKYTAKLLGMTPTTQTRDSLTSPAITPEFLAEQGFL